VIDNGYIQTKAKIVNMIEMIEMTENLKEMQNAVDAMQEKLFISQWY
jgi:hypothetical protein